MVFKISRWTSGFDETALDGFTEDANEMCQRWQRRKKPYDKRFFDSSSAGATRKAICTVVCFLLRVLMEVSQKVWFVRLLFLLCLRSGLDDKKTRRTLVQVI